MTKNFLKIIFKSFYKIIPFKKFLFLLTKTIYDPPQTIYRHLAFKGVFSLPYKDKKIKIYHTGTFIENQIFWKGVDGYEPNSLKIWIELCKTSKTIFDLGANTGIYSLLASAANPHSIVHSFEPVERNYKVLKKNISLNGFNINCHNKAVSEEDGISFFIDDYEEFTSSVIVNEGLSDIAKGRGVEEDSLQKVETEIITLDSFIKQNNISQIDLMKIDVETHEREVFKGFKINLEKFKPTFLVEIIRDYVASYLDERLSGFGYNYFYINEPFGGEVYKTKGPSYQKIGRLEGGKFGNYLICEDHIVERLGL